MNFCLGPQGSLATPLYLVLGLGPFYLNYCLNAVAWHGCYQPVALLRCSVQTRMLQQEEYDIWSPCPGSVCVLVALDALTPASVHSLWRSPTLLNGLFLTILSRLRSSLRLVHLFLPHFSLPLNFLLMCFDTALWEHPTSFVITFWGFCQWWFSAQLSGQQSSSWWWILLNQTETI